MSGGMEGKMDGLWTRNNNERAHLSDSFQARAVYEGVELSPADVVDRGLKISITDKGQNTREETTVEPREERKSWK